MFYFHYLGSFRTSYLLFVAKASLQRPHRKSPTIAFTFNKGTKKRIEAFAMKPSRRMGDSYRVNVAPMGSANLDSNKTVYSIAISFRI